MTRSAVDPAASRKVWAALSELYLDTEITPLLPAIAHALAESDDSVDALGEILFNEVDPVLRGNLRVAAGVWDAFDQDWLADQILKRLARPPWRRLPGWFTSGMAKTIWPELASLVARCRNESILAHADRSAP